MLFFFKKSKRSVVFLIFIEMGKGKGKDKIGAKFAGCTVTADSSDKRPCCTVLSMAL